MFKYIKGIIPEEDSRSWFWLVMIVLLSFYPYKLANAYFPIIVSNIQTIFAVTLLLAAVLIVKTGIYSFPRPIRTIIWVMVLGCLMSFFYTGHKFYYHKLIIMFGGVILLMIVYAKIGMTRFFTIYNRWILIMAILGVLGFWIAMAGVPPLYVFSATEDSRPISSWFLTFTKQIHPGAGFIRYAGFFDEPGAMGYWGVYALVINRLFIKDWKLEKMLIICLLFTFSMGYYSQIAIFLILTALGSRSSLKTKLIWIGLVIGCAGILYGTKNTKYHIVYKETIGRFEQASQGEKFMEGTSREKLTNDSKEIWLKNLWMGFGWPVENKKYIGDNPYETLAHDGIVGTVYLYFPFILLFYWSFRRRDYELFSMTMFMVAGFLHRPFHFNYLTFFIFYSIPLMYYEKILEEDEKDLSELDNLNDRS